MITKDERGVRLKMMRLLERSSGGRLEKRYVARVLSEGVWDVCGMR